MKRLNAKDNVLKPALIGCVVIVLGIALLVYYRYFAKEWSVASYVVSAVTLLVGVLLTVLSLLKLIKIKKDEKTILFGEKIVAEFLSYGTEKTSGKVAVYYIEYSYEQDGKKYIVKSPSQFTWYEVLTLKAAGKFDIRVYKGNCLLDCDLLKMQMDNREEVAKLNQKYEHALEELVREKETKK